MSIATLDPIPRGKGQATGLSYNPFWLDLLHGGRGSRASGPDIFTYPLFIHFSSASWLDLILTTVNETSNVTSKIVLSFEALILVFVAVTILLLEIYSINSAVSSLGKTILFREVFTQEAWKRWLRWLKAIFKWPSLIVCDGYIPAKLTGSGKHTIH